MKKLRIGVVGSGFTGQQHIEAARRIPGVEVVALADTSADSLAMKAEALCIPYTFTNYRQMLAEMDLDVVHNCTPNGFHYEINRYVMEKKINIYCEKPLATSLKDARELVALAVQQEVAAGVNFNYRNNAMVREMRERVVSGDIGRILMMHGHYLQDWMMFDTDFNWRLDEAVGGKSRTIADIGSHWFDTVQFVTGKKIAKVFASMMTVHPTRKKPNHQVETFASSEGGSFTSVPINSEDAAMILMEFEDGVKASLVLSQVCGGHKNDLAITLEGQRYSMTWEQEMPDRLRIGSRDANSLIVSAPDALQGDAARFATLPAGHVTAWSDALRNSISEYYTSIRTGSFAKKEQSYATFARAADIMAIVDSCIESNQTGQWVNTNLL